MTRVSVPAAMLQWACERAGYDVADVERRVPQLQSWMRREKQPTLKQLEQLASATHTPLGYLLLPEPPEERLPVPDYRTVTTAERVEPSPDLLDARRALDLNLVDRSTFFDFYERYVNREHGRGTSPSGGDFYNNQNTRIGEMFAVQVLRAALEGRIGFKEAYDLTGLRGGTFQKYARRLGLDLL